MALSACFLRHLDKLGDRVVFLFVVQLASKVFHSSVWQCNTLAVLYFCLLFFNSARSRTLSLITHISHLIIITHILNLSHISLTPSHLPSSGPQFLPNNFSTVRVGVTKSLPLISDPGINLVHISRFVRCFPLLRDVRLFSSVLSNFYLTPT